jgi:hypothetical protein
MCNIRIVNKLSGEEGRRGGVDDGFGESGRHTFTTSILRKSADIHMYISIYYLQFLTIYIYIYIYICIRMSAQGPVGARGVFERRGLSSKLLSSLNSPEGHLFFPLF